MTRDEAAQLVAHLLVVPRRGSAPILKYGVTGTGDNARIIVVTAKEDPMREIFLDDAEDVAALTRLLPKIG